MVTTFPKPSKKYQYIISSTYPGFQKASCLCTYQYSPSQKFMSSIVSSTQIFILPEYSSVILPFLYRRQCKFWTFSFSVRSPLGDGKQQWWPTRGGKKPGVDQCAYPDTRWWWWWWWWWFLKVTGVGYLFVSFNEYISKELRAELSNWQQGLCIAWR